MINNLIIDGVILFPLKVISDSRGNILHMLKSSTNMFDGFGECYFSEINPGYIKAWKQHLVQIQNLAVPIGDIEIVLFDSRINSPTFELLNIFQIGRTTNYSRLRIPNGVWYGFRPLNNSMALISNCPNLEHDPTDSFIMDYNIDSFIPYRWK
jgi:dTDP-4-dehydrorhamnose 3,5-epimerase